jgi:phage shock protein PspC (stress-responsive transcriptional regulator)
VETTQINAEPRRLTRPAHDRWLGGVASGLGEYFDLSPTIYRIAFVALALAGGTGVLLYLAAWLVIPEDGAADSIAARELAKYRDRPRRLLGFAVLGFIAILVLSESHVWPSPGNIWLAFVLGIAAVVWWRLGPASSARRRIVAAFALALVALLLATVAFAVRVPLFAGVGQRVDQPVDVSDVHSKYELGIGSLTLDFGGVSLPRGETFVKARVGIGDLKVFVPADATVEVEGRVQAGQLHLLDEHDSGTHVSAHVVDRTGSGRVLVLDARTGLGNVEVERR